MRIKRKETSRNLLNAIITVICVLIFSGNINAQAEKTMLGKAQRLIQMKGNLISRQAWHPYPTAGKREAWSSVPENVRRALIARGRKGLKYDWPSLPATLFLDFVRTGNRSKYQNERSARRTTLCNLVLAECVQGKGRFIDDIVNGVWIICEESYWGLPAHLGMQKAGPGLPDIEEPTVDLFAGETGSLLAWTLYLLGPQFDEVSPLIRKRVHRELENRILTPCLERDDFGWMGFRNNRVNNWNPWCNSNWLAVVLLSETDEDRRVAAVKKVMKSLDNFIGIYPADGGCDEGPGYWGRAGASLFDCLELLHSATNGAVDIYDEPLIQEIGRYIYRVQILDDYFINFADASARVHAPADLVYRYGKRIGDDRLAAFGAFLASQQKSKTSYISSSIGRQLPAIFNYTELTSAQPKQPLLRDVWMPEIQVMAARSQAGSGKGLFVAAKGGHNAESHNHNDVGNFIVYMDGHPIIIDVGVETYTRKTFSSNRYDIWTMQSQYHNLPTINGIMQQAGRKFTAEEVSYIAKRSYAQLKLEISNAYPPEAGIASWVRTIRLNRGKDIRLVDNFRLTNTARELTTSLMTPGKVSMGTPGKITLRTASSDDGNDAVSINVYYEADKLSVTTDVIPIKDRKLQSMWGKNITRIIFTAKAPLLRDKWIMRITP